MKRLWEDKDKKGLDSTQIDNRYLLNIIKFISSGGGDLSFISEDKIDDIYDEALVRGLKPKQKRSELKMAYRNKRNSYQSAIEDEILNSIYEEEYRYGSD